MISGMRRYADSDPVIAAAAVQWAEMEPALDDLNPLNCADARKGWVRGGSLIFQMRQQPKQLNHTRLFWGGSTHRVRKMHMGVRVVIPNMSKTFEHCTMPVGEAVTWNICGEDVKGNFYTFFADALRGKS